MSNTENFGQRVESIIDKYGRKLVADIYVERVDVGLLRQQRNELLRAMDMPECNTALLDGLIELLDFMLDKAEGY